MRRVVRDAAALYREAAAEFTRVVTEAAARRAAASGAGPAPAGACSVALAGGSTPRGLYRVLADPGAPFHARLPWNRIHFFFGDERQVPPDHDASNYRMARDVMLAPAGVPAANVHRIRGELKEAAAAADEYEADLRRHFGAGEDGLPRFDLVLLGMGADGHTASLFPGSPAIAETERWAVGVRRPDEPFDGVTLTPPVLNNAAHVIFLVAGAAKAAALKQVLEGDDPPERLPSRAIRPLHGTLLWLLEREAAALLVL